MKNKHATHFPASTMEDIEWITRFGLQKDGRTDGWTNLNQYICLKFAGEGYKIENPYSVDSDTQALRNTLIVLYDLCYIYICPITYR